MDDFLSLAKKRRSVRNFNNKKIAKEDIEKIIEAGIWAPSAWNQQQSKFFVLTNPDKIKFASEEIVKIRKKASNKPLREVNDPIFYDATTVVLICAENELNDYVPIDAAFCAENCLLCAEDLGISSCIIGQVRFLNQNNQAKKELSIPENWQIILGFCLGYSDELTKAPERNRPEIIFNK